MTVDTAQPMIRLDVSPSRAPIDAEITVRVLDASPGGQVTLTARSTDAADGLVSLGWAKPDLSHAGKVAEAAIAVERINGPVLLISGADDQTYGPAFQEAAAQRLAAARHPHPFRHIVHEGAGHLIATAGYRPTTRSVLPGPGVPFQYGGTPAADAAARRATWRETLRFLDQALRRSEAQRG